MSSKKYDDFENDFHFQRRMHNLLQEKPEKLDQAVLGWQPDADILQTSDRILILMEVPGVRTEDLAIVFEEQRLRIRGVKPVNADSSSRFHRMERSFGEFRRVFRIEEPVDQDRIEASIRNGVLQIVLYKKNNRIAVEIASS